MRISDTVFGLVLLLGALALFIYAVALPGLPGQDVGPGLFPKLIAVGFAICGAVLLASGYRQDGFSNLFLFNEWAQSGGRILDVVLVIGGLALLMIVWDITGFLIGATLYSGCLIARFMGGRYVISFGVALVACLIVDWSFRKFLLVPLPLGPLASIIW
jgi:putative tricarboxylic transport membrane protein